jgi:transposase
MKTKKQTPISNKQTKVKAGVIKLGLDIHKNKYVVVVQIDGSSPQRAKSMSPDKFLSWIRQQLEQSDEVHSCYEAGCFGYSLHRKLIALGVCNLVVRPRSWDVSRSIATTLEHSEDIRATSEDR